MENPLRNLRPEDEPAVLALVEEWGERPGFHWPAEHLKSEFRHARGAGLWDGGELMAFVFWRQAGGENEITVLASRKDFARRGWMKKLLSGLFAATSQRWLLEVHGANRAALSLYEFAGFREIGRRPKYYRDGGSAVLMAREPKDPVQRG